MINKINSNDKVKLGYSNHLIDETSPYLQAHAHNPVNWYPWGEEALNRAKKENKLIFLSIGYHACHWCHVMEKESFEDEEVANILNDNYICIKVDREERKDIDAIYMKACQLITGSGGWPLNLWLTPDKLPIYAGTYFPKKSILNRIGLIEAATHIQRAYLESPNSIFNKSYDIVMKLKRAENHREASLDKDIIELSYDKLREFFDPEFGGFSRAPKFPVVSQIMLLLEADDVGLNQMALVTLKHMAKGGIYDHIGGGFSRYSVDRKWLIPHFEKMLYDNGLLLDAYSKAYEMTGEKEYKAVIEETVEFLDREMKQDEGGFYSAYDADSEGIEGKYYSFLCEEVVKVLGAKRGRKFCDKYNMTTEGNFEGYNIPNLINQPFENMVDQELKDDRKQLYNYRAKRVKPALDDKILAMSNAYVIHGLLSSFDVLGCNKYLELAKASYAYIQKYMIKNSIELISSVRNNQGEIPGMLDDYASLIRAALKLYYITIDDKYLDDAINYTSYTVKKFWDEEHGGFFVGSLDNKSLIYNPKELYDGATPSGNSIMAMNLLRIFMITKNQEYKQKLDAMIEGFSFQLNEFKHYASNSIRFLDKYLIGSKEVIVYIPDTESKIKVQDYLNGIKNVFVKGIIEDEKMCVDQFPTLYECQNGYCNQPVVLTFS